MKLSKIKKLRKLCIEFDFIGADILKKFSNRDLCKICNGIGADWFPEYARTLATWMFDYLNATAMQHDVEFFDQIGFETANAHFLINGRKEVKAKTKWYDIRRYIRLRKVQQFYILLENFGLKAYEQAGKQKVNYLKKYKQKSTKGEIKIENLD